MVHLDADPTDQETTSPTEGGYHPDHPRADPLEPLAGNRCRQAQRGDGDSEDPDDLRKCPIPCCAGDHTANANQCRIKNAPGVNRTDAEMDGNGSRWNLPAVVAGRGNDPFFRQQRKHVWFPLGVRSGCPRLSCLLRAASNHIE